jgi:Acetyltransferases, including N-acetylases of ribosomal proteins
MATRSWNHRAHAFGQRCRRQTARTGRHRADVRGGRRIDGDRRPLDVLVSSRLFDAGRNELVRANRECVDHGRRPRVRHFRRRLGPSAGMHRHQPDQSREPIRQHGLLGSLEPRKTRIASTAARLASSYAFADLGLVRIEIVVLPGNAGSRRVAEKIGARFESIARSRLQFKGETRDAAVYSLVRDDAAR